MAHPIEAYSPSLRTRRLACLYLEIKNLTKKTARQVGILMEILVETNLSEYDLVRIARHEQIHA